jgi:putative transposase
LLQLNRSGLYYQPQSPAADEIAIKHRIDELYTAHPFYGSRKITALLQPDWPVNRKRIQRYMREMGIAGLRPGPNLSKRRQDHAVYPYLLHGVTALRPNHIWGVDITYIRCRGGWMYLVAFLDWFARYVVSWALDETLELPFVLEALRRGLTLATPTICNSDQGSQFTSPQYCQLLAGAGAQISMDGKGRAFDNIFTERLWRTVKYEEVYLADYQSPREVQQGLSRYFRFYNEQRPHQSLDYRTPAAVYFATT